MAASTGESSGLRVGAFVMRHRVVIGVALLAITAFMGFWASRVKIATKFENFFPADHANVELYRKYTYQYGGAQTLAVMLRVKQGDIFNYKTLKKIQDITREVNILPGVDHNEIFSLASYRVAYSEAVPGAIIARTFMYPRIPATPEEVAALRHNVLAHHEPVAGLVTHDLKGALITAAFSENELDYGLLFKKIQKIIHENEDANTTIYVAGEPMIAGWSYYYLGRITVIFFASIAIMLILLYARLGDRSSWWAPALTGSFSALWGLGFVSLMGYNFDPVMMVIPFILSARDLSHGIQWQGRYYDELDRLDDKFAACAVTTDVMLPPGALAIIADIAGIIFISFGGIPVLKEIGLGGAVWLAASLTMVFIFQPIFMSYLPRPTIRERGLRLKAWTNTITRPFRAALEWFEHVPITPGIARNLLLAGGAAFIIFGILSGQRARIGYNTPGTPLYRPNAKVNQDIAEIGKFFPTDEGWIVLTTPDYPDQQSSIGPPVLRMSDDMGSYLVSRGDAVAVVSFANLAIKPLNSIFHNGFPKYRTIPSGTELGGNLWYMFFAGTAPGEIQRFFAYSPRMTNSCIRVLLPDHTYDRLNRLRADIRTFIAQRIASDPLLSKIHVEYLGGEAGLFLAANDVLYRLDFLNITVVLAIIFLFCAVTFQSLVAAALFIVSCVMANFGAFIYMNARDIGITIDTIPVISLGIGLGVDYGIYMIARVRDEVKNGLGVDDAILTAFKTTGSAVFSTFAVMVGGVLPWAFSPLLFHNEMSLLLIFLMFTNMIAGVLILPSYVSWRRPKFVVKYEEERARERKAAAS
ncbi:MAG: efflux RND transporter permease subunit [Candidatus Binataceae bacterium]